MNKINSSIIGRGKVKKIISRAEIKEMIQNNKRLLFDSRKLIEKINKLLT